LWICGVWEPPLPCRSNNTENKRITPTVTSPRLERPAGRPKKHAGVLDRPALAWDLGMSCVCVCVSSPHGSACARRCLQESKITCGWIAGRSDAIPMHERAAVESSVRAGKRQLPTPPPAGPATDGAERPRRVGAARTGARPTGLRARRVRGSARAACARCSGMFGPTQPPRTNRYYEQNSCLEVQNK